MKSILHAFVTIVGLALLLPTAGYTAEDLPQISVGRAGPCCPSPRFLAPRSRDGNGTRAAFDAPAGIAYDPDDDAYFITDAGSNTIRRLDSNGTVTTVAGACDPELVRNDCMGRELDGLGSIARFNRPTAIVYDRRRRGLLIYDRGASSLRFMTPDGRVRSEGTACCINAFAINARNGFVYAAQGRYVSQVTFDNGDAGVYHAWTAPVEGDRDAPVSEVNALAVDAQTGDILAAVSTQKIYRLHPATPWTGKLFVGRKDLSFLLGGMDGMPDGKGAAAQFQSISALAFDSQGDTLYVSDFRTIRAVARDGTVISIAGGCQRQTNPRYRGEFACDYPPNDGNGMKAHFAWPIPGIVADSRRGALAILTYGEVKRIDARRNVVTIAGNRQAQPQPVPYAWDGRYLDTATGETLDVYVRGDNEVEIFKDRIGRAFDVRHGFRSQAASPAQFWNADSYVRTGRAKPGVDVNTALAALGCGQFREYTIANPDRETSFTRWYASFARGQTAHYHKSARCVATRVTDGAGRGIYEDVESTIVPHYVPSELTEYPDERVMYHL